MNIDFIREIAADSEVKWFRYTATSTAGGVATFALEDWTSGRQHAGLQLSAAAAVLPYPYATPKNNGESLESFEQKIPLEANAAEPTSVFFFFPKSPTPQYVVSGLAATTAYVLFVGIVMPRKAV